MISINFKGFFQSVGNGIVSLFKSPAGKQAQVVTVEALEGVLEAALDKFLGGASPADLFIDAELHALVQKIADKINAEK